MALAVLRGLNTLLLLYGFPFPHCVSCVSCGYIAIKGNRPRLSKERGVCVLSHVKSIYRSIGVLARRQRPIRKCVIIYTKYYPHNIDQRQDY